MTRRTSSVRTTLAVLAVLGAAVTAPASAAPVKKAFHESLTPSALAASAAVTLDVTLTNDARSAQTFGSAEILIPTGYTGTSASADVSNFSAGISTTPLGEPVVLVTSTGSSATGIAAGKSLHVLIGVTTPASSCRAAWVTYVKQSNDFSGAGNEFLPADPAPTTTVGSGALTFTTQPSDTQYDKAMLPAPVVALTDPCGAGVTSGAVTLTATGDAALTTTPVTALLVNGQATFPALTFTSYGFTDTLTASYGGSSVTSDPFDVVQSLTRCAAGASCTTGTISDPDRTTLVSITADTGPAADVITATVKGDPTPSCGGATSEPPLGRLVTFNVRNRSKHVVMTLPKAYVNQIPNNGTPFMDICLDVPDTAATFLDKRGVQTRTGLVPDCGTRKVVPCVTDRRKRGGDEIIGLDLPPGDPHGSWY